MYNDRRSRHVEFAKEPIYSRASRADEVFVMERFERHARNCPRCHDPYSTYREGRRLCDVGHPLAKDVVQYLSLKGGKAYSRADEKNGQTVRVEIPPGCPSVMGLLQAVRHGILERKLGEAQPVVSHDKTYHVPPRPDKRYNVDRYNVDRYGNQYYDERRHGSKSRRNYEDQYRYPEKRHSTSANQASYSGLWGKDGRERDGRRMKYDSYYYQPPPLRPEMRDSRSKSRIPRSESPKRESYRRTEPEDYRSYGRRSQYDGHDRYRSSRDSYPNSRASSRLASPDSYGSYRRGSPGSYSSKRSTWSPDRLYRDFLR